MRSILITGGNGGLGRGIGRYFLEKDPDCRVWLGVRSNRAEAEALSLEFPGRCQLVDLDVTDAKAWEAAVAFIVEADGRLDVLVNNAGLHRDHLLAAMPAEAWHDVISSNLDSVFHGCRAVVTPMMRQRFGRIVNIASLSAILPPMGQTNYAAAKAGVVAFSRTMAKEVGRAGITVNCIPPGRIHSEQIFRNYTPEYRQWQCENEIPAGRYGEPEDLANLVCFLSSPLASYITGTVIPVDGGLRRYQF